GTRLRRHPQATRNDRRSPRPVWGERHRGSQWTCGSAALRHGARPRRSTPRGTSDSLSSSCFGRGSACAVLRAEIEELRLLARSRYLLREALEADALELSL